MNRRIARRVALLLVLALVVALGFCAWHARYRLTERNVREVEPARIYAGGYQYSVPLARILEKHRIKTVLSLRGPDAAGERDEDEFLARRGVAARRVAMDTWDSIPDSVARVEQAVQIMAQEENQPVFVHCFAGMHRVGVVIAAFRVSHCGWSEEQARNELLRYADVSEHTVWACDVLRAYCQRLGPARD